MPSIESFLEEARKSLVETGTRNRLIHVNRKAKRGNLLNIINERSDDVFQILRLGSKKMKFSGRGKEEDDQANDIVLYEIEDEDLDEGRYTDSVLETPLTPDALQKRLLRLSKDARTAEEEQGINILFLAMGFLRWYEDKKSTLIRESPLILLPVELVRNNKTLTFDVVCKDDDVVTNLPLQERLKLDFGIALPDIDDSRDWNPSSYFLEVSEAVSGIDRWSIDPDGMQLGFFSFAKLMMMRDLHPDNWDEKSLLANKLVSGLLADGFEPDPPLFGKKENLDEKLSPDDVFHVVDADSSQTKVIEEARSGRNLVVQGPPGTGKSQTIINILAAAANDGKKVLFVAEKMAALEVVYSRMCKIGLKDLCLELHSRQANKKIFLQALAETISRSQGVQVPDLDVSDLELARDELNRVANLLHGQLPGRDYTPFEVLSSLISFVGNNTPAPRFDLSNLEHISKDEEVELFTRLKEYLKTLEEQGRIEDNPFFGVTNLDLQPTDLQRLGDELNGAIEKLIKWMSYQRILEEQLFPKPILTFESADSCRSVYQKLKEAPGSTSHFIEVVHKNMGNARFKDSLRIADDWVNYKESKSELITESGWENDLEHLKPHILKGMDSWISRMFGKYQSASRQLSIYLKQEVPKTPDERLKMLLQIIVGHSRKRSFEKESDFLKDKLGEVWMGERTPFSQILHIFEFLEEVSEQLGEISFGKISSLIDQGVISSFDEQAFVSQRKTLITAIERVEEILGSKVLSKGQIAALSLEELQCRMRDMSENIDAYYRWTRYKFARAGLLKFPVENLLEMIDEGKLGLRSIPVELRYAISESRWKHARSVKSELNSLARLDRHALVRSFSQLEWTRAEEVRTAIRDQHLSQVPKGSSGKMGIIRGEIAKTRNHRPIRQMMQHTSQMIQRIKPVLLMSPISVAQFLPPGKVEFDLLVIDEASQIKPEDALGAIARAKQIVVLGDQKQLPPTSFFDRLTGNTPVDQGDEDEEPIGARATEMESILSLCEARGFSDGMLEWHYRSRDPSLIAVSNLEFYNNRLILPPCPTESDDSFGLRLIRVPGVYSTISKGSGRPTTNRIEAEAIADRVRELAVTRPDFSVGIATFSKAQADMVTEVLEFRRRKDDILDLFLREDKIENVFVKNIENVQGDERDLILISVGYGPHEPNGRLISMSFGPVNSQGGERRLNVLFSRSRIACEVFTSFDPGDIDLRRTSNAGPRVLKKFLEYAKTGEFSETYLSQRAADSQFEENVASVIRDLGYEVDYQVGTAGFRIDLGVKNPKNPQHHILAVECDGATYHSALWARERDRLRQEILEGFGWHFHRIWSTDWFYQRDAEIQRLREALEQAGTLDPSRFMKGANRESSTSNSELERVDAAPVVLEEFFIRVPKYRKANIVVDDNFEPHERKLSEVTEILCQIVAVEGLVHVDEISRRYAGAHGKRAGSRTGNHVVEGLSRAERAGRLQRKGKFWGTEGSIRSGSD